uniref:myogenesis-regulating glycosidase-like n=1 Tax=Ciona intestinalis TaxID=7719 RepID=UPI000180C247|nr:myogenesis-regulating glycosidase-like [Ciona intestinalis]|eukprot:XP_018667420.1 myogenesis-regulating glycosidase-like [Ciona intestinalis]
MQKRAVAWTVTGIILACGIVLTAIGTSFLVVYNQQPEQQENIPKEKFPVYFDPENQRVYYSKENQVVFTTFLNQAEDGRGLDANPMHIKAPCNNGGAIVICYQCELATKDKPVNVGFTVTKLETTASEETSACYETTWTSDHDDVTATNCFPFSGAEDWFGGAEMYDQSWPINSWYKEMSFYLSGDMFSDPQQFGSVLERYWLSSQGVALYVEPRIPLHVSVEKQQICFKGAYIEPYKPKKSPAEPILKYTVCLSDSPQRAHAAILQKYFKRPTSIPDLRMIRSPIWSTWARYKVGINETVVLQYADEILKYNFSNSQIEIDDGYEKNYGDHTFSVTKFPDASGMIKKLHNSGFRVTTWVTPFVNLFSENYAAGDENGYFVMNGGTNTSGRVAWWNGIGSSIDFTNPKACDWYYSLLEKVRSTYGVDSFKFDAGEINYITAVTDYRTHETLDNLGSYTQYYSECAARLGTQIELRASWNNQHLPVFVRMMDKDSNWSKAKGIKTLVSTALTFSMLGYPYILPDMIGGNAYGEGSDGFHSSPLPEKELYIRWLEVTAFLPSMQFSICPWQYDDETVKLAQYYVQLHENVVFDEIVSSSQKYVNGDEDLGPIRPIWWATSNDRKAFKYDDEFMVGDKYLVAPILDNATRSRDIYLPGPLWRDGVLRIFWKDKLRERELLLGGVTLFDYKIELNEISWWELILESSK